MASNRQVLLGRLLDQNSPFVGEEELALAREGGAGERGALARRLSGSSIGDQASDAFAMQIAMAPTLNRILNPSISTSSNMSDYTPIDFIKDIASALNPFGPSEDDNRRKDDYQQAFRLIQSVIKKEPNPDPRDLDPALVFVTNRTSNGTWYLLDNKGTINPMIRKLPTGEYVEANLRDLDIPYYVKSKDWNNGIVNLRKYIIDRAKKGDPQAKSFYAHMIKSGWRPGRGEEVKLFS